MERALPLAQALPPGFSSQLLDTVVPQIVRSLHMQVTTGGGDMRLTLTPEHLGTVTIELRVEHQRVAATLGADTPAVRVWIAAHEQDLKAGLADLGLLLDEFVVRDDDPRDRRDPNASQQARPRRKRAKSEDSVFEVEA
jgi:flagellar hook-length control protein FliK